MDSERRSGRTTRFVDFFVQELFTKGIAVVYDHHPTDQMKKYVWDILNRRLRAEHSSDYDRLKIDKMRMVLVIPDFPGAMDIYNKYVLELQAK